jgi:nuclear pore complex protein Nup133
LCTRFGSEDLRKPIVNDNLADDEILREHAEKHRLDQWFEATAKAVKLQHMQEKSEARDQQREVIVLDSEDSGSAQDRLAASEVNDNLEAAASEAFEGDDEQSVADQEDVDMEDA